MITEEEKFRADTFRMFGIILLTPLGQILLDPQKFFFGHNLVYGIFYLLFALLGATVGFAHIEKARGILDKRGINKWR